MATTSNDLCWAEAAKPKFVKINNLSDFLSDYTLIGQKESERLVHFWRRWAQILGGLWTSERAAYGLFYHWVAESREIRIYAGALSEDTLQILHDVLRAIGVSACDEVTVPQFPLFKYGFLITQGEAVVSVSATEGKRAILGSNFPEAFVLESWASDPSQPKRYLIYQLRPFWGPGEAFILPFEVMSRLKEDVVFCTLIKPYTDADGITEIVEKLSDVSRECDSAARQYIASPRALGQELVPSRHLSDPQLKWCAQVYAAHLRRLTNPFFLFGACFSDDETGTRQVAQAIANSIHEERSFEPPAGEAYFFPQSAQILPLEKPQDLLGKCLNLEIDEDFLVSIPSPVPHKPSREDKNRTYDAAARSKPLSLRSLLPTILRHLCDARGAATLFRFPVNINSGIPGIIVRQRPPDFHPGVAKKPSYPSDRSIRVGKLRTGDTIRISISNLCKHILIVGTTGSGKTNTSLNIVHQLAQHGIPFMVIESAKKEYRSLTSLLGDRLRVYTVGNELCSPIRINPFELFEGVRVESHISRLQTCFEAALPQDFGSLSSILSEALHSTYAQKGWSELDVYRPGDPREFPMMEDFINAVSQVINKRYRGEIQQNMRGVLLGRLEPFRLGSKRRTFNVLRSEPPIETLLTNPVILELDELNLDEKALFALFLIVFLREYCDRKRQITSELQHVTLIEEAHNVLEQVGSVGSDGARADTRHKAVQAFCQMLAEIRAYGEGLIIVDQSPVKLARDAIRNTNIQIVHLLRDSHDREAMTTAMIMDSLQSEYVGKLCVGEAAIFYPGLEKSTFILTEAFNPRGYRQNISDEEIKTHMEARSEVRPLPYRGCERCTARCKFQEQARKQLMTAAKDIHRFLSDFAAAEKTEERERILHKFTDMLWEKGENKLNYAWCIFVQYYAKYNNTKHPLRFMWDSLKRKEESVR